MTNAKLNAMLTELRSRAESGRPGLVTPPGADELARVLHELDVYHAELEIQNQDLLTTQQALSLARDRYHAIFDAALTPMFTVSGQGVVVDANRAMVELSDRPLERFVGRPFVVCLDEGSPQKYFQHLQAARETGRSQQVELLLRTSTGSARTIIIKSCLLNGHEQAVMLCHATDVTAARAREAERRALELRVKEAEKLEAVGRVAANIAHDVNNCLMSIVSMAEFVVAQLPPEAETTHEMAGLIEAAWRGGRLMRGLLGLSKPSTRPHHAVNVGALLEQVANMCRHVKAGVDVHCERSGERLTVHADEDQLLQAVLNLAKNALEATTSGSVTLSCSRQASSNGDVAEIIVRDSGCGMDSLTLERATEPLFTTKSTVGGSGLGLTLAHRTVAALGGSMTIESLVDTGTTVRLQLPVANDVPETASEARLKTAATALRALLVDDDPATRAAVKRQLVHGKVAVHDFADGPSALNAIVNGLEIDVAVIDVNMPVWSGPELVERLLALNPELPTLFITGASGDLIPDWMLRRPQASLLHKPWPRDALLSELALVATAGRYIDDGLHDESACDEHDASSAASLQLQENVRRR